MCSVETAFRMACFFSAQHFLQVCIPTCQLENLKTRHVHGNSLYCSFWQKCCQAFAEQLVEQGFALQAAAYMLAIHQQHEAIAILMEKKLFKEAALIARVYLQKEDPLMDTITEQWISHLTANGNLTGAALL